MSFDRIWGLGVLLPLTLLACTPPAIDDPDGAAPDGAVAGSPGTAGGTAGSQSSTAGVGAAGATAVGGATGAAGATATGGVGAGGATAAGGAGVFTVYKGWPFDATEAAKRQQETAAALGITPEYNLDLGGGVMLPMEVIPAGESTLGIPATTMGYENDEHFRPYVQQKPFLIGKTVVTREQYKALLGAFPVQPPSGVIPAEIMTDSLKEPALALYAVMKTKVLPALQAKAPKGWTFRLPGEDEWEYSARAGTGTVWYTGDTPTDLDKIAWFNLNSGNKLHDVGLKLPNAWHLYDMIGNAWHFAFYPATDYYGDTDPVWHLVRGGGATSEAFGNGCRTSNRNISDTGEGYRFVADVPVPAL